MTAGRTFDLTCSHKNCTHRGTYQLPVRCSNCGAHGVGSFTRTHEADAAICPDCETRNLRPTR